MDEELRRAVWWRARGICEYCRLPEFHQPGPFEVDHIIARQHGGQSAPGNLALACLLCNSHKGPNIAGIDPLSSKLVPLFNPRRHKWERHFRWDGPLLIGRTPMGRATVVVLAMNDVLRVSFRLTLMAEGLFPPAQS